MSLPRKEKIEIVETTIKLLLYRYTGKHHHSIPWSELEGMGLIGWPIDIPIVELNNLKQNEINDIYLHLPEIGFRKPHYYHKTQVVAGMITSKLEKTYGQSAKIVNWMDLLQVYHMQGWPANIPFKRLNELREDELDMIFYSVNSLQFSAITDKGIHLNR